MKWFIAVIVAFVLTGCAYESKIDAERNEPKTISVIESSGWTNISYSVIRDSETGYQYLAVKYYQDSIAIIKLEGRK